MRLPLWLRAGLPTGAAAAGIAFGVLTAFAATESVQIVTAGTSCTTSAFCYVPNTANAASGDTVTWTNTTVDVHTVTRCDATNCSGQGPGSGGDTLGSAGNIAASGGTYQHTFSGTGTYFYYCAIHGYSVMHGEVIVTSAPGTPTPESPLGALVVVIAGGGAGLAATLIRRRRRASTAS